MALLTVFSDNLNPTTGSLTARFTKATGFYIDAPFLSSEMETDVFLQVYFPTVTGERLRNLRLGSLKDGQITLNETDTETIVPIPNEFLDSGLEMALFFTPSDPIFLEVYVVGAECTLCGIKSQLNALQSRVNNGFAATAQTLAAMQATLSQILTAVGIDVVVPGAVPSSIEQDFFFLQ